MDFRLVCEYKPAGDQARAIEALTRGVFDREQHQVLLGVTGSGKTFTMAKVIENANRPSLVLAHNKTLAAQLYHEFKSFFPQNAVEYFVSYYDYYQPEAYVPAADLYIEKESTINDELDKLRLSATKSLFERRDTLIVASVSCIYGLGSPEAYYGMLLFLEKGQKIKREDITRKLVEILYERTDGEFRRGTFRVRGDVIEIFPTYDDMSAMSIVSRSPSPKATARSTQFSNSRTLPGHSYCINARIARLVTCMLRPGAHRSRNQFVSIGISDRRSRNAGRWTVTTFSRK